MGFVSYPQASCQAGKRVRAAGSPGETPIGTWCEVAEKLGLPLDQVPWALLSEEGWYTLLWRGTQV